MRQVLVAVALTGAGLALSVLPAAADPSGPPPDQRVASIVVIDEQLEVDDDDNLTMRGEVVSRLARCERGRTVVLRSENRELIGELTTDRRGQWQAQWFAFDFPPGQVFRARTPARTIERADGTVLRCGRARTNVVADL